MFEQMSNGAATLLVGAITAVAAWLGGMRSGRAQLVTAASEAAERVLKQQSAVIERMEGVIQRQQGEINALRDEHGHCTDRLRQAAAQINELRTAADLPPWDFE